MESEIDPEVQALTKEKVLEHIQEYKILLDKKVNEHAIHGFLSSHSYFFNGILRMYGYSPLYSKVKLGNAHEVDFAFFDTNSFGPEWHFIEIESPKHELFNKSGDPSSTLTHAIRQVQDWKNWLYQNLDYAKKYMPGVDYPFFLIFMGRRNQLTEKTRQRLKLLNYENRLTFKIHTFDHLAECAHSVLNLLERSSTGDWPVPMKALGHAALMQGLPVDSIKWFNQLTRNNVTMATNRKWLQYFREGEE